MVGTPPIPEEESPDVPQDERKQRLGRLCPPVLCIPGWIWEGAARDGGHSLEHPKHGGEPVKAAPHMGRPAAAYRGSLRPSHSAGAFPHAIGISPQRCTAGSTLYRCQPLLLLRDATARNRSHSRMAPIPSRIAYAQGLNGDRIQRPPPPRREAQPVASVRCGDGEPPICGRGMQD
ncbi:hypothetical protein CSAL01_06077 [Colletotrichum salicis]|uniref:Uncharacterized protein n=1 Tax=Colletotrichum salicis TaxID=1209931 RepID=A0A135V3C9_9PEZI|nr:hypothetical protein CSAL01_06077 [Colletotrichum salicis]